MKLRSYAPPRHPAPIDLDLSSNEGRAPRDLPSWNAVLAATNPARYPRLEELRAALASRLAIGAGHLLVTAGGDDLLLRVALSELGPDRAALVATPTFEMIPRYVALANAPLRQVAWPAGDYPIEDMLAAIDRTVGVVFLVTPNNPTGLAVTREDFLRLANTCRSVGALLLVDHAYVELGEDDFTSDALTRPEVVVLRTLSKAWGLAGLRVGYGVGDPEVLARLAAAGNPYAVSSASAAIAIARLATGGEDMRRTVDRVRIERAALREVLRAHGFEVASSQANFVLARGPRASWLADALASLGIAVRLFPDRPDLHDAVRVGCPANEELCERLLDAIDVALDPTVLIARGKAPSCPLPLRSAPDGARAWWLVADAGEAALARRAGAVAITLDPDPRLLDAGAARAFLTLDDLTELLP